MCLFFTVFTVKNYDNHYYFTLSYKLISKNKVYWKKNRKKTKYNLYNTDCLFRLRWTKSTRVLPLPFPGKMWHMLALNQVYFLNYQIKNILKNKKRASHLLQSLPISPHRISTTQYRGQNLTYWTRSFSDFLSFFCWKTASNNHLYL